MASFKKICKDNPHFFKVVLPHAIEEQKLEIPKKFVRQYGLRALSKNQTCLKLGDGREWDVGLTKSNGRVWFDCGWQKFVEFYAVGLEYFLVFKYDNNFSNFNVVIFDLTATEIEYPTKQICVDEDEESVKMETSLEDSCSQVYKVGEVSASVKKRMNSNYGEVRNPTLSEIPSSIAVYKRKGRTRATEEATAFQSRTLNPSFMSKISPSCFHRRRLREKSMAHGAALRGHKLEVLCLATAGRLLLSGSADMGICVWQRTATAEHSCLSVLTRHTGPVKCLAVEKDHEVGEGERMWIAYSGSLDKSVKIWRVLGKCSEFCCSRTVTKI